MKTAAKAVLAIVLAAVGLQLLAEKMHFSTAMADSADDELLMAMPGGNIGGF